MCRPWGPINSFHPKSLVFKNIILKNVIGLDRTFVEIGVRYHIFIIISLVLTKDKSLDSLVVK